MRADAGEETASEPAWFETAKMDEPWQAKWITCDYEEPRHPVFFKELALRGEVAQARLYVCGLGVYEARICDERMGWTGAMPAACESGSFPLERGAQSSAFACGADGACRVGRLR